MTLLNENFSKELQRMAELAGVQKSSLNENITQTQAEPLKEEEKNIEIFAENKTILTEMPRGDENEETPPLPNNNDDEEGPTLFGDEVEAEIRKVTTPEKPIEGELDKNLKAAMVLNNLSQYEAALLDLYAKYNPKTTGALPADMGGDKETVFGKSPTEKLAGGSKEVNRLAYPKFGIEQKMIDQLEAEGIYTPEEIERLVADKMAKLKREPLPWDVKKNLARWQPTRKNASIISYVNGALTNRGKQQLEFLSRMLSQRPLHTNEDENVNIEQALFDTAYKPAIIENSEGIIRDFYSKALVPILSHRLKRNNLSPQDAQFDMLKTSGIDHAIDMTKAGQYDVNGKYKNYGNWFMTVAINKAIDGLKPITDYKVDINYISDMLYSTPSPFKVKSKLSPDKAVGNFDKYEEGSYKTKNGELKTYYTYVYNDPTDAMSDFLAKGNSPLSKENLLEKGKFYVSTPKYVPPTQDYVNPTFDENIAVIPGDELLKIAAGKVNGVLDKIASQMVDDAYNSAGKVPTGETVKMSRPTSKPMSIDFYTGELLDAPISTYNYENNFTRKKEYEVLDKKSARPKTGGPDAGYYKLLDDNGKEFWVRADSFKSSKKINDSVIAKLKPTKDATIEILKMMLQYGDVIEKYTKTVYFYNPRESDSEKQWTRVDKDGKVRVNPKTGEEIIPFKIKGDAKSQYKSREEIPTKWVWDALDTSGEEGTSEVNKQIIDELSRLSKERNFNLSQEYFDADKNPRYKKNPKLLPNTIKYLNTIRKKLKDYFSEGAAQSNVDFNNLLKYYKKSEEAVAKGLAENHIRKAIREMLAARLLK